MRTHRSVKQQVLLCGMWFGILFTSVQAQEKGLQWGLQIGANQAILVGESFGMEQLGTQYETGIQGAAHMRIQTKGRFIWGLSLFVTQWQTSKVFQEEEVGFRFREFGLRIPFGLRIGKQLFWTFSPSGLLLSEGRVRADDPLLNDISNYRFLRTVDAGLYTDLAYEWNPHWGVYVGAYHSLVNLSEVVPLQLRQLRWEVGVRWWL